MQENPGLPGMKLIKTLFYNLSTVGCIQSILLHSVEIAKIDIHN